MLGGYLFIDDAVNIYTHTILCTGISECRNYFSVSTLTESFYFQTRSSPESLEIAYPSRDVSVNTSRDTCLINLVIYEESFSTLHGDMALRLTGIGTGARRVRMSLLTNEWISVELAGPA